MCTVLSYDNSKAKNVLQHIVKHMSIWSDRTREKMGSLLLKHLCYTR